MTSLKVLSAAAAMALLLPLAAPTESFAQKGAWAGGGGGVAGGGGGPRPRISGGGGPGPRISGGGGPGPHISGGGGPGPHISGGGGGYRHGGAYHGGYRYGGGGFLPGLAIGGALASSYGYYGAPYGYGAPYEYYDEGYYDEPVVAVVPGGDSVAYCQQRFRSYDVRSGTYLGFDGLRHPCP